MGLLLGAATALAGCSGAAGTNVAPFVAKAPGAPVSGGATVMQQGHIVLPPGVALSAQSLTVTNSLGSTTPVANGSFTLLAYSGGPQYTLVTDKAGSPVLAGFLGPASTTLDSLSTAKVFVYFAAAFYTLPSPFRSQMVDAIASEPGFASVQSAIETALAANPEALANASGAGSVAAALATFVTALYAPNSTSSVARQLRARRFPQDVTLSPSTSSGVTVIQDFPNGIHFHNTFRRAAEAFIDEVSFVASGATTPTPKSVLDVVPPQQIPATSGLGNVSSSLITAVQGLFSGATQYTPVDTSTIPLALEPGSASTTYNVTVVGAGLDVSTPALTSEQSTAQKKLVVQQLVQDIVVPFIVSFIIPINSAQIDNFLSFTGGNGVIADLVGAITTTAPQVSALIDAGDVGDALILIVNTIESSNSIGGLLQQIVAGVIQSATNFATAQAAIEKANSLTNTLNILSGALVGIDMSVVEHDILSSDQADLFVVTVTPDTVKLSPATATLDNGASQALTTGVPAASGTAATFAYTWSNTAAFGHIFDGISGHEDNFTSSSNVVTYVANATGAGVDTVTVSVAQISGQNRIPIGSAHATMTVQPSGLPSISLDPSGCVQFPFTGGSQTYTVTVTNPPAGVTLEYGFAIAGNHGTLSDPGATLNAQTHYLVGPSDSATLNMPDVEPSPTSGTGFNGAISAELWFVTASGQLSNTFPGGKLVDASALWGYGDVTCSGGLLP